MNDRFKFKYVYRGKVCRIFKLLFEANEIEEVYFKYPIGCTLCSRVAKYNSDNLLQCTGLKDKNGTLIYEGDIVEVQYIGAQISLFQNTYEQEPQPERFAIIYDYNWHKFTCKNKYYRNTCEIHSLDIEKIIINPENKRYEVIGNIYENPELLKSEE